MYRTVVFKSAYPDEWKFDEKGNPLAPGARELADNFVGTLANHVSSVSPVEQHSYYGWRFVAKHNGCTFHNVMNPVGDECYMTLSMSWYWLKAVLGRKPWMAFDRYCGVLDQVLHSLTKVSNPVWEQYRL